MDELDAANLALSNGPAALLIAGIYAYEKFRALNPLATATPGSMAAQIKDLHEWHDKEDEDGVKVWYIRKSLADAIMTLASVVSRFGEAQDRQITILDSIARRLDKLDPPVQE